MLPTPRCCSRPKGCAWSLRRLEPGDCGLRPPTRTPRGVVTAVENLGDLVHALGPRGGVAGGGPQVDVPEPGGDLVDRDAGLE